MKLIRLICQADSNVKRRNPLSSLDRIELVRRHWNINFSRDILAQFWVNFLLWFEFELYLILTKEILSYWMVVWISSTNLWFKNISLWIHYNDFYAGNKYDSVCCFDSTFSIFLNVYLNESNMMKFLISSHFRVVKKYNFKVIITECSFINWFWIEFNSISSYKNLSGFLIFE